MIRNNKTYKFLKYIVISPDHSVGLYMTRQGITKSHVLSVVCPASDWLFITCFYITFNWLFGPHRYHAIQYVDHTLFYSFIHAVILPPLGFNTPPKGIMCLRLPLLIY